MKEQRELLDAKKIIEAIPPQSRSYLSRLDIFCSIDSTNTYLLLQGKQQPNQRESGWVCLAEQQTQGRGRQGKEWFSPYATNIYCSLTWAFPTAFPGLSALSLVCGVLLIQMLKGLGIEGALGLKWPNDVLFSGRKLAGILLETRVSAQQNWVVIGLGLNHALPQDQNPAWIGVEEILGKALSRNRAIGLLLDELFQGLVLFEAKGLKPFLPAIREHDLLLQKEVVIQTPQRWVTGLAQGLSEDGDLLLLDEEGKHHRFCYGEASVRLKPS